MITHYFKVAFRNLWKYRTQNIISILGLAAGFICFALSALWIRYELTYDDFHKGAERIYYVRTTEKTSENGLSSVTPLPLAGYLRSVYPDIEDACSVQSWPIQVEHPETKKLEAASFLAVDSTTLRFFGIKIMEGSRDFLIHRSGKIALTEEYAAKLFPDQSPLGQYLNVDGEKKEVCAVVAGWSRHSSLCYDLLSPLPTGWAMNWNISLVYTFLKFKPGVDRNTCIRRLEDKVIEQPGDDGQKVLLELQLTPLNRKHSDRPGKYDDAGPVKLYHVQLFAWAGILLIACSLLNYLGVFISQLRLRSREMALRIVCGSSGLNLSGLLLTELLWLLGISLLLGLAGMELCLSSFIGLVGIVDSRAEIYQEALLYLGGVIGVTLIASYLPISYFRRHNLQTFLHTGTTGASGENWFRKGCLWLQLVISLGFIFCTAIMLKQLYFLNHTDLGVERSQRATAFINTEYEPSLCAQLQQRPEVVRVVNNGASLLPPTTHQYWRDLTNWPGKPEGVQEDLSVRQIETSREVMDFYGIHLVQGEMPDFREGSEEILINETLCRKLQLDDPVGVRLWDNMVIKGVVRDFQVQEPTSPVFPTFFQYLRKSSKVPASVLIEYRGEWAPLKDTLSRWAEQEGILSMKLISTEEAYENYLKSERLLMHLLEVVSGVCILVSLFGVYSLVTLSCEQRRKEIAIRKVNGATVEEIFRMFFREYLLLLGLAALVAFPVGTLIMRSWLENYTMQTSLSFWLYLLILCGVALCMASGMGWRVWKAARQNPAEVIKSN